ncbi:ABC transporter permease [Pseudomarimonas arenosa]|uniref:ABC transporter permease n=1 Tax=Pseudomarimonas arenosa TaxID=2774145 RepID=A0AAW3ZJT1_9GAMM|nr:ABC transporter permease [Pseudomarimonas arenosa]MBD8526368.1 ABC transporter permease [Pseudomarimonas arenosa]
MKTLFVVMHKELLDLFRDRRTFLLNLLMGPLLFPALILGMGALAEKRAKTQLESTLKLPVVGAEHAPNLVNFLSTHNIEVLPAPADADAEIRAQNRDVILRIPAEFGDQWRASEPADIELIFDSTRRDTEIPLRRVRGVLDAYSQTAGHLRLLTRGVNPQLSKALRTNSRDLATPEAQRGQILSALLPYLLILSAFLGGAYLVIDATAGERERQSLEPLLATPASRSLIMSGKIGAACVFGLVSLLLIMVSFKVAFLFAGATFKGVEVTWWVTAKLLVVLMPMVLLGTTLLTLLSASAKSMKEAQSYMGILMLLPMIPTIILMVNPIKDQLWMFTVPFLAQNQLIIRIVRSEPVLASEWGVYLAAGLGLGALLWLIAARLYHREKLAISA